jgi:O-antigen/teichoic acid export membrane protein
VTGIISLILRLGGVGGKFAVMLILAREAGAHAVGEFALFFGAVNLLTFVIGLDFHLFSIRELLLRRSITGRLRVVAAQAAVDGTLYVVACLIAFLVWFTGLGRLTGLPIGWLLAVVIADHLSLELSRLFQILRHPHTANIIYAAKSGLWGWVGGALILTGLAAPNVTTFYTLWAACDLVAIAGGMACVRKLARGSRLTLPSRLLSWFKRGVSISRFFYATSVATMVFAYIDRFIIAGWITVSDAGKYVFWQSIAGLLPIVTFAMAGMHYLPILVESFKRKRPQEFAEAATAFMRRSLLLSLACSIGVLLLSPWIPVALHRPEFVVGWPLVAILLVASSANAMWQVPYQVLYSAQEDRFLAVALISLTIASIAADLAIIPFASIIGAACVSAVVNVAIYFVLQRAAKRHLGRTLVVVPDAPRSSGRLAPTEIGRL